MDTTHYQRTLITAALPYANGPVHIGHLAGVYIPADICARYLRLKGEKVLFVGGSDEHGVPVTIRARQEGCSPQDVVDRFHHIIQQSFQDFGISFDIYSRTTSPIHHRFAADFFTTLHRQGKLIQQESEQFYDEQANEFITDRNIRGECPHCHAPEAYGDQCEKCGNTLSPEELIHPYNAATGHPLVKRRTTHWYLPLNDYQQWLEQWILEDHKEWRPNVYGQCKSWLDGGLKPRAVTRDLSWGIPVPLPDAQGKVLYVWFDAPIGYISNTKELCDKAPEQWGTWQQWWQRKDTRILHFIGKDNIVFHCIVFPVMLKAHGGYQLPDNVPANEFLNLEGDKLSTSRNHAVWLNEYLQELPGKQDVLRYVLTACAPETKDNDFTWAEFQARNNNELVAVFGNFVNRALQLTQRYYQGVVPPCHDLSAYDRQTISECEATISRLQKLLDDFRFRDAQKEAMNLARIGNKYIADEEPWKVYKTDPQRVETIIYLSLQITANLAIAFDPFLPFSAQKLREMTNMDTPRWQQLGRTDLIPTGKQLNPPSLLFEKIEDDVIQFQLDKLKAAQQANPAQPTAAAIPPQKPTVDFDTFQQLDLRVGTVTACEKVPKMKKLLQLTLDDGTGQPRTIISGLAQHYEPQDIVGKQVCFIANLAPRQFKNGLVSQGMILCAQDTDGKLTLTQPDTPMQPGSIVC